MHQRERGHRLGGGSHPDDGPVLAATSADYCAVRALTERLAEPLSRRGPDRAVDAGRQPDEVAPGAHHLVLRDVRARRARGRLPAVRPGAIGCCSTRYYDGVGPAVPAQPSAGADPGRRVDEVSAYRRHVDAAMLRLLERGGRPRRHERAEHRELGLHHEQQHQELMLTDIKHVFRMNPLRPGYVPAAPMPQPGRRGRCGWLDFDGRPRRDRPRRPTASPSTTSCPRHRVFLEPFRLADRGSSPSASTWRFIDDGGYRAPGPVAVRRLVRRRRSNGWEAPLYWSATDGSGRVHTLGGTAAGR